MKRPHHLRAGIATLFLLVAAAPSFALDTATIVASVVSPIAWPTASWASVIGCTAAMAVARYAPR